MRHWARYGAAFDEEEGRRGTPFSIEDRSEILILALIGHHLGRTPSERIREAAKFFDDCAPFDKTSLPFPMPT